MRPVLETSIATLQRARQKIDAGWTQGTMARDAAGKPIVHTSKEACSFCSLGALYSAYQELSDAGVEFLFSSTRTLSMKALEDAISVRTEFPAVIDFNDGRNRTKAQVLEVFDEAIADLQAQVVQ